MAPDPRYVAAVLKKAAPEPLPALEASDAALVLTYPDAATLAARCSADDAAVRALKGVRVGAASMRDVTEGDRVLGFVVRYPLLP